MHESPTNDNQDIETTHDNQDDEPIRPDDMDWDAHYAAEDQVWSGEVNGSLAAEAADLPPGRALDVGCGEGADAIWLAERGWQVTALDISPTAVARGRREAERRGLTVDWRAADLLHEAPGGDFDLVSLQYPAFGAGHAAHLTRALTQALAPEGVLILVGHAFSADTTSLGYEPTDWVQPPDIIAGLPVGFTVVVNETRPRPGDHHAGSVHVEDVVVRIVRT